MSTDLQKKEWRDGPEGLKMNPSNMKAPDEDLDRFPWGKPTSKLHDAIKKTDGLDKAFARQLNLRTGYKFSQAQIINFLVSFQTNPQAFSTSQADMPDVQALCVAMADLHAPDGGHYLNVLLRPRQHVQRLLHPNWQRPYISKFKLRKSAFKEHLVHSRYTQDAYPNWELVFSDEMNDSARVFARKDLKDWKMSRSIEDTRRDLINLFRD